MVQAETIHRYPRITSWIVELLATLAVVLGLVNLATVGFRYAWRVGGLDRTFFGRAPYLTDAVAFIDRWSGRAQIRDLTALLPALGWMAGALLLALLLRNAFPVIRSSSRGLLVEFANSWLPVGWETVKALKVTEDLAGERFVLLAQTDDKGLTGWHRLYSLVYNFGMRRGILITSQISEFDTLVKTLVDETSRTARLTDNKALRLEEKAWSPLFRFLLSPASFFSRRAVSDISAEKVQEVSPQEAFNVERVQGAYPARINLLFVWGSGLLALLALWQYLIYWVKFLTVMVPLTRRYWPFNAMELTPTEITYPWMQLVAAHLLIVLVIGLLVVLRNLLPALETVSEGLRERYFGRWRLVPWAAINAIKVTEFSEQSQVVLLQTRSGLPSSFRFSSLFYDGSLELGVLMTSAISNFEPLLQRIVLAVAQAKRIDVQSEDAPPLLQRESQSSLLRFAFRPSVGIDQLVEQTREDENTKEFSIGPTLRAAGPMVGLALPVALLPIFNAIFAQGNPPGVWLLGQFILLFVLGMIEWPLAGVLAPVLDEMSGGGEEGQRPLYLYPLVQLPRILAMVAALVLLTLSIPVLPVLLWLGAIIWSFLLAAGLWEALYGWKGSQLLLGGLIPVAYQLIVLLIFLLTQR